MRLGACIALCLHIHLSIYVYIYVYIYTYVYTCTHSACTCNKVTFTCVVYSISLKFLPKYLAFPLFSPRANTLALELKSMSEEWWLSNPQRRQDSYAKSRVERHFSGQDIAYTMNLKHISPEEYEMSNE